MIVKNPNGARPHRDWETPKFQP